MAEALPGLEVETEARPYAATLRYFEADGPFAATVAAVTGTPLPGPLSAVAGGGGLLFAWLRPTETLVLSREAAPLASLKERLASAPGGHVVDLSGALEAFRVSGARMAELLTRLGDSVPPAAGQAGRRRLADLPVLALSVQPQEVLLVVDRAYAEHLGGWIEATLAGWRS
ncbi:MAG TPA: sarcosine oxidase subunit gamma family protein [Steroidobacteraceae bacterium]|nr:sarcosine oxidase subunit gamma family protein [Steroidobacteraceae bacterium]